MFTGTSTIGGNIQTPIRKGMEPWKAILIAILPLSLCGLCGVFGLLSDNGNRNIANVPTNSSQVTSSSNTTENRNTETKNKTSPSPATQATDATTTNKSSSGGNTTASGDSSSTNEQLIIGNKRSKIYHWPGCPNYNDIASHNREYFETRAEAESAGYRAARNCDGGSSSSTTSRQSSKPTPSRQCPAGATALCRDGTCSYSANRRGTCSHHGGVAVWY